MCICSTKSEIEEMEFFKKFNQGNRPIITRVNLLLECEILTDILT